MIDRSEIGSRLRMLREAKGLSTLKVGKILGVSHSALSMYETGKRIPKDDIKAKLADFYGLSIDELFFSRCFVTPVTHRC